MEENIEVTLYHVRTGKAVNGGFLYVQSLAEVPTKGDYINLQDPGETYVVVDRAFGFGSGQFNTGTLFVNDVVAKHISGLAPNPLRYE